MGVGVGRASKGFNAFTDFWKDSRERLVIRFSSQGYIYHFKGLLSSGKKIPKDEMDDFGEYVAIILLEWLAEGVDELSSSIYENAL